MAFLMLPRPSGWVGFHVHKEDGTIFLSDFLARGWSSLFEVYSGYVHVFPRLVAGVTVTLLPLDYFPVGIGIVMALVRAWFTVLAWPLFTRATGSWRWGLACASTFLFLPVGQQEVLGNITNLRWFGVAVTAMILLSAFRGPGLAVAGGLTAALAVLSDPLALLLAPLAIVRLLRASRWGFVTPGIYLMGSLVQAVLMRPGERAIGSSESILSDPIDGMVQTLVRGVDVGVLGLTPTQGLLYVGGVGLVACRS